MISIISTGYGMGSGDEAYYNNGLLEVSRNFYNTSLDLLVGQKVNISLLIAPTMRIRTNYVLEDIEFDFSRVIYKFRVLDESIKAVLYLPNITLKEVA